MPQVSSVTEMPVPENSSLVDRKDLDPKAVTNGLKKASETIRKHEVFLSTHPFVTHANVVKAWVFRQYEIPDHQYGTRATDRKWIISFNDSGLNPDFTLSAITVARDSGSKKAFPVLPEIRIRWPLSEEDIKSGQYTSFGDMGICTGLRLIDGTIEKEDGGNPKNNQQMLERARLVVDTFTAYLNRLLPKKP